VRIPLIFFLSLVIGLSLTTSCGSSAVKSTGHASTSILNDKYGFIDKIGTQVIAAQFSGAKRFSEGLVAVSTGKMESRKWGYVDKTGKWAIPAQFDDALQFHDGLAIVQVGGLHGYINKSGQYVVKPQFTEARPFYGNINAVAVRIGDEEYGYRVFPKVAGDNPYDGTLAAVQVGTIGKEKGIKNKWGYIDRNGNLKIEAEYCFAGTYYEDLALVKIPEKNGNCATGGGGKWGYIDRNGKFVIKPIFEGGGNFHEGLTWATPVNRQMPDSSENRKGYIDKSGKFVIPPKFARASDFSDNLAAVALSEKNLKGGINIRWGFVDKNGTFIIPPTYWSASRFQEGFSIVEVGKDYGNRKPAYLNTKGKLVFTAGSVGQSDISGNFFEEIARVNLSGSECSYINTLGEFITKARFNGCADFYEGVAGVMSRGEKSSLDKSGYINQDGSYVINLESGSGFGDFSEGLAAIRTHQ
jgi:WG containing repeat